MATEASKDGSISRDDYEWMCKNMIGDDTGDNISHLNRYFCELTEFIGLGKIMINWEIRII